MNVYITSTPMLKLWTYIESLSTEVGGWGYAKLDGDDLVWHEIFLVPQHATTGEVDFEATNGDTVAIERAIEDKMLDKDDFVWVSWHSHHSMKPFWSKTDDERIEGLAKAGIKCVLSFVGCHDHTYRARLDLFNVEHHGITVPHVTMDELKMRADPQDELFDSIFTEIQENVKKPPVKQYNVKPVTQLGPAKQETEQEAGERLERAFTIKALIEAGFTRQDAEDLADDPDANDWIVGPSGVMGFDQMAWGDHETDATAVH